MKCPVFIVSLGFAFLGMSCPSANSMLAVQAVPDAKLIRILNPAFADWRDGQPVGWRVEIGANNGANSPVSEIRQGLGPSLELTGNLNTKAWKMVSQTLDVRPQQSLCLSYAAKACGVKREGNQFDNCYVGVFFQGTEGAKPTPQIWSVVQEAMTEESKIFRVPDQVNQIQVIIFLSKTGKLTVSDLKLELLDAAASFDILVQDMARNYSFLEHKKVDWPKLTEIYRDRATTAASPAEFATGRHGDVGRTKRRPYVGCCAGSKKLSVQLELRGKLRFSCGEQATG